MGPHLIFAERGEVIGAVEQIKGEGWSDFHDRYGDSGWDLVLYAGQRVCGMKLRELAAATGMTDYGAVLSAIRRFERWLRHGKVEQEKECRQPSAALRVIYIPFLVMLSSHIDAISMIIRHPWVMPRAAPKSSQWEAQQPCPQNPM
jgi:hypothetical protein